MVRVKSTPVRWCGGSEPFAAPLDAADVTATATTVVAETVTEPVAALIGRQLRKRFGREEYTGTVRGYRMVGQRHGVLDADGRMIRGPLFRVVYSDGDREELELHELRALLLP
jgi:hypothetical protein